MMDPAGARHARRSLPPVEWTKMVGNTLLDLELVAVTKTFGDFVAVDSIDLRIARGEFVAVMGPSGCGKSTLLRIISGLETMSAGQMYIRGKDVSDVPVNQRSTRLVWQNFALFPHLNVFDNIAFGLTLEPHDKTFVAGRVHRMAEIVGMTPLLQRRIGQLSGGQKQRVALARALVTEPEILLLDEPLSALDAHLRLRMQGELRRIQQELGVTFIYVTHNQVEAFSMADRVVVMNSGHIDQIDTPEAIYNFPATPFVASFVGMNNIFQGRVLSAESGYTTVHCSHGPVTVFTGLNTPPIAEEVTVVVQADKLHKQPRGMPHENQAAALVTGREYAGSQNIYLLDLPDGKEIKLVAQESPSEATATQINKPMSVFFAARDASIIGYAAPAGELRHGH
jgi:spermidine/putrescine transport system ATP-binding protein